jgi:hypothetical protein
MIVSEINSCAATEPAAVYSFACKRAALGTRVVCTAAGPLGNPAAA